MRLVVGSPLGHDLEEVIGHGRRIQIEQPDPLEAIDRVQLAQQPRERPALVAIDAVERGVLRDEQQLLDAARRERSCLADDRIRRTAAIVSPQRRDDTSWRGVDISDESCRRPRSN